MSKHYAQRDSESLGELYFAHIDAMTREGLHLKSAIAAELAYRDMEIRSLREQVAVLRTLQEAVETWGNRDAHAPPVEVLSADIGLVWAAKTCREALASLAAGKGTT